MVAGNAGLAQDFHLLVVEQPHRGAEGHIRLCGGVAVHVGEAPEVGFADLAAGAYNRETAHAAGVVAAYGGVEFLRVDEEIFGAAGMVGGSLGTPAAVFGAAPRAAVDYRAGIEMVAAIGAAYAVGCLAECLQIGLAVGREGLGRVGRAMGVGLGACLGQPQA